MRRRSAVLWLAAFLWLTGTAVTCRAQDTSPAPDIPFLTQRAQAAVMSTLWQIADDSTARLMSDFYDGLINQGLDKAHALQRAQVALIKGETERPLARQANRSMTVVEDTTANAGAHAPPASHPYYWAAFILMGNWM